MHSMRARALVEGRAFLCLLVGTQAIKKLGHVRGTHPRGLRGKHIIPQMCTVELALMPLSMVQPACQEFMPVETRCMSAETPTRRTGMGTRNRYQDWLLKCEIRRVKREALNQAAVMSLRRIVALCALLS